MRDAGISFIVPVYNVKPYLTPCVESILRYPAGDAEIILIDDGSTDGSGDLCDAFSRRDARVRVIHQENAGVSAARNAGLDCARGRWICFVDGDDLLYPQALVKAEKLLAGDADVLFFSWHHCADETTCKQDARCSGRVIPCGENDMVVIRLNAMYRSDMNEMAALGFKYTYTRGICCCLWRAEIIQSPPVRLIRGVRLAEDVIFRLTCLRRCRTGAYIDEDLYGYRMVASSATHRIMPNVADEMRELFPRIRGVVREVYRDDPRMLGRMYAAFIMESRRLIDLYLNHPDCALPLDEKAKILNDFLQTPLMRESLAQCDGSKLIDPIDHLYDAYRIADPEKRYLAAVQAVKQQSSHSFLKKTLGALGLLDWAKYSYRALKRKLRAHQKDGRKP